MKVLILSGAGLSAESGLRTFRDSGGLWEEYDISEVCSTQGWEKDRAKVTRFYNDRRAQLEQAVPNAAHFLIAELQKSHPAQILNMTQNVDNLLEKAGCTDVVHLHGTLTELRCEECGATMHIGYSAQNGEERCPGCKSVEIRHNVVMFGEAAPEYLTLQGAIAKADAFVAIGTSGQVIDIAAIAKHFEHSLIVNPKKEPYYLGYHVDDFFSEKIFLPATEAVGQMREIVCRWLR